MEHTHQQPCEELAESRSEKYLSPEAQTFLQRVKGLSKCMSLEREFGT